MSTTQGLSSANNAGCSAMNLRRIIALMAILCTASCYISRQNLSLAITAMTNDNEQDTNIKSTITPQDHTNNNSNLTASAKAITPLINIIATGNVNAAPDPDTKTYGPRYPWKGSSVLSAFFYTYVACQIPGGRLAETVGPKWILFSAAFGSAILSYVSPLSASLESTGYWSFFGVRLLMGVFQSAIFPACYTILTNWLPLGERRIALTLMNSSAYFGSIIAMESTGYFTATERFGWTWAFYFPAIVCFVWSCIWFVLGTNHPEEHRCISKAELEYIEANKGDPKSTSKTLDWYKLLTSTQVWGVVVAFFSSNWSFSLILQMLPSYLSYIQGIGTIENGRINEYMYAIYCVSAPLIGAGSSYLITNKTFGMSRITVRKLSETIAVWGQCVCFIIIAQLGENRLLVQVVLYFQMLSYSFVNGGEVHLPTEISADFGGTIYAIANCIASTTGFIIPSVMDWIVTDKHNLDQWNRFLYVAAVVSFVGNLTFILIGGNSPEDISKAEFDHLSSGTFKLVESSSINKPAKSSQTTGDIHVEMSELNKLKTSTKDYNSIKTAPNSDKNDSNRHRLAKASNGRK